MRVKGKTAVITGATGKLGRHIALHLAENGANCICLYHKKSKKTQKIEKKLKKITPNFHLLPINLTKTTEICRFWRQFDRPHSPQILINSAATFSKKPINKITPNYIKKMFDLNFTAPILMTKKFAAAAGKKKAVIINVTDQIIQKKQKGFAVYSASKAALQNASEILTKEMPKNITIKTIAPPIIHQPKNMLAKKNSPVNQKNEITKILKKIDAAISSEQ